MKLSGKVALITGAGSGMGRASALLFASEGARVAVVDIDARLGEETVEAIGQSGGEAVSIEADVSNRDDAARMIATTVATFGRLDILFNNAGVSLLPTPTEDLPEASWDKAINVNLKSLFLACKHAIPVMKAQGGGVIINTASASGVRPRPGTSAYCASKAGAIMFTKALALELAPFGIRVNCINPGPTDTPMAAWLEQAAQNKNVLVTVPLGRLVRPEEVAHAALYLASEESSIVTGIGLDVDGGRGI